MSSNWWSSSDSEDEIDLSSDCAEFKLDWLNLPVLGLPVNTLGLSALPGCRFKDQRRSLTQDLDIISSHHVTDVMVLMKDKEFRRYKVPNLLAEFTKHKVTVHHRPIEDGGVPTMTELLSMVNTLTSLVTGGSRILVHCYGGLGRTCLVVAAFLLSQDPSLQASAVINMLREVRGPRAIQTVKQYNMIQEFRRIQETQEMLDRSLDKLCCFSPPSC